MKTVKQRLITLAEKHALRRAARILMCSDEHDEYFFVECLGGKGKAQIQIGEYYALVKTKEIATNTVCTVTQVKEVK